jgi:hypothetical protein
VYEQVDAQGALSFAPLAFTVTATDPDGDAVTALGTNLVITQGKAMVVQSSSPYLPGATFTTQPQGSDLSVMTGTYTWPPGSFAALGAALGHCSTTLHVIFAARTFQQLDSRAITLQLVKCGAGNGSCPNAQLHAPIMLGSAYSAGQMIGGYATVTGLVGLGMPFALTGGDACDPDGTPISYAWSYLGSDPPADALSLQNLNQRTASGTAPATLPSGTTLSFQVQVTDTTTPPAPVTTQTVAITTTSDCIYNTGKELVAGPCQ